MKVLGIIGCGHLGHQIANIALSDNHYDDVVFFDDFSINTITDGFKVIGKIGDIEKEYANNKFDHLFIGIGYKHLKFRLELFNYFWTKIPFGKIVHSSCYMDKSSIIEDGCIIYPRSVIDYKVFIKKNSIININCTISHNTIIGQNCFVSPNCAIAGFVNISNSCFIGLNSTIIDHVSIESNIFIGAGTVVTKDVFFSGVYVGNPIKKIK
jgi:sugar O-acyltransferase (sialic acid O-acetyltransferase NeuD family)